jgi:hypothetical protein
MAQEFLDRSDVMTGFEKIESRTSGGTCGTWLAWSAQL